MRQKDIKILRGISAIDNIYCKHTASKIIYSSLCIVIIPLFSNKQIITNNIVIFY